MLPFSAVSVTYGQTFGQNLVTPLQFKRIIIIFW